MGEQPKAIPRAQWIERHDTPGMIRGEAIATDQVWAGVVETDPAMTSGWHHHGAYETVVFVLSGGIRIDFGDQGRQSVSAGVGEFLHIPRRTVHRESNTASETSRAVVVRAGGGVPVVNVAGPGDPIA
jgi:uncharacterized RmlC-like cupin family protein